MRTCWRAGFVCLALGLAGCAGDDSGRDLFALRNPFRTERGFDPAKAPTASTQIATRVHAVGQAVIAANGTDIQTKPLFVTVGLKEPMIFHRNEREVILTEGLVKQCQTDGELAAAICHELGKIAAESGNQGSVRPESDLPPAPRLSADVVGSGQPADMTRLAEEAKFDRRAPRAARGTREPRSDPRTLAQNFLIKAGHSSDDLARIEPLLKEADENAENRDVLRR